MTVSGEQGFRSGFAVLAGRPNAGKSTLLNRLVGRKVAITSHRPQTTRNRIAAVLHRPDAQVVFMDTPGLHSPQHRLGEYMVKVARSSLEGADVVLFVVEADSAGPGDGEREVARALRGVEGPLVLVLNKIDRLPRPYLAPVLEACRGLADFRAVHPVSALTGAGVKELVEGVISLLPEGPPYYPADTVTDQPERQMLAELVREQVLIRTREEIPHSVAVDVEQVAEREDGLVQVAAVIYVEKDSQKGILIGKGGHMLKEIGKHARAQMEELLEARVFLELWVKVKEDWRNREGSLRAFGYRLE